MMSLKPIQIGLNQSQKEDVVRRYLEEHGEITNIVYFRSGEAKPIRFPEGIHLESREYADAIMYKYFYPLLENINERYLIVYDGMLRTLKRNDLTYNCCCHYNNQTPNVLVFQYFPMAQDPDDYMILVDLATRCRYRAGKISGEYIKMAQMKPVHIHMSVHRIKPTENQVQEYEARKNELFEKIGNKDPNTIPRSLHMWAGSKIKKSAIYADHMYVARNSRFKKENVFEYKTAGESKEYFILDFPIRVMQFTDFLERSGPTDLTFIHSGLPVDDVYYQKYMDILEKMEGIYAQADLYQ